ncbi:hypothetical protein GLYMA_19G138800v4 [Glycine max]|nr:hypothetical protein GLYMA_19G138800v4 [Glycine max]KAH1077733.1 hypothetical protein GYH30_053001 [Glycine max]
MKGLVAALLEAVVVLGAIMGGGTDEEVEGVGGVRGVVIH